MVSLPQPRAHSPVRPMAGHILGHLLQQARWVAARGMLHASVVLLSTSKHILLNNFYN